MLSALSCSHRGKPPVWLMRQAGRYLPEYRQLRQKHSFLTLCHQPDLAAEVTLQPVRRFQFDAAILFSDILVIPEALGLGLQFDDEKGPQLSKPVRSRQDVEKLPLTCSLEFVADSIRAVRKEYAGALLGFSGAPFTLATYMIEGKTGRSFKTTKEWMWQDPAGFHLLLERITEQVIEYLKLQMAAGVDAVQLFDSWANILSDAHFRAFSLPYLKRIVAAIAPFPVILFCRGSSVFAPLLAEARPAAISLDWQANLLEMRQKIPSSIALQGNLDPDLLYAPPEVVKQEVQAMVRSMQNEPGYIFNLGHGILPDTQLESVYALVEGVRS